MIKSIATTLLLLISYCALSNDGAFYAKGNQLFPIKETDISVKKEILTLKKVNNQYVEVTVYYEFFNPKQAKKVRVGFEAFSPSGDVDGTPKNGQHPYMSDFTVEMNSSVLRYDIAYVSDTLYRKSGEVKSLNLEEFKGGTGGNEVDFYYVHHFDAHFKKGVNIIKHTYNYDLSSSVNFRYSIEYVLTAAKRWANGQIDDFTLIIDTGNFQTFFVEKSFFESKEEWIVNGIGKLKDIKEGDEPIIFFDALKCHLQKGRLFFQKQNFKPAGDLFLCSRGYVRGQNLEKQIPFSFYSESEVPEPQNDFQRKILKNLPFARRGYIFKNQKLNLLFRKMEWYFPNPNYVPDVEKLSEADKKWIEKWN